MKRSLLFIVIFTALCGNLMAQAPTKRTLKPSDVYNLKSIGDPQVSPEGKWVAYTLSTVDSAAESEQMYQALRSLGVPTQQVVYPNQFHDITVPSY